MADLISLLYYLYLSIVVEKIVETVWVVSVIVVLVSVTGYVVYTQNEKHFKETGRKITWSIWVYALSTLVYVMIVLLLLADIWGS